MKLSELTENDAVKVSSLKEGKKLSKELNRCFSFLEAPYYLMKSELGFNISSSKPQGKTIIPAIKLLKSTPTKKELQAALTKLEDRVNTIERDLHQKSISPSYGGIQLLKDVECDFENVKEGLPEKWCVLINDSTHEYLNNWVGVGFTVSHPWGYFRNDKSWTDTVDSNYTEITFEQFKKWVLGGDVQPAAIDWSKAGQLVESNIGNIALTSGNHKENTFEGAIVKTYGCSIIGSVADSLVKECFKLYTGEPVTLTN